MDIDSDPNPLPCLIRIAFAIIGIVFLSSSPDWVIVVLSVAAILWQGFVSLRYFAMKTVAGNLLTRIPNHRNLSRVIIGGIFATISAALHFIEPPKALSAIKLYSIEALLAAMAIFSIIEVFRYTEIRENGILYETGIFYHWKQIESFDWTNTGDKLSMKLRNSFLKKNAKLAISSSYEKEITNSFAQYTRNNYVG
jgi:hypothetical protein